MESCLEILINIRSRSMEMFINHEKSTKQQSRSYSNEVAIIIAVKTRLILMKRKTNTDFSKSIQIRFY